MLKCCRLLVVSFLGLGTGLVGCAPEPVCDRVQSVMKGLDEKKCEGATVTLPSQAVCVEGQSACSPNDLAAVDDALNCLESIPACAPGAELEFVVRMLSCDAQSKTISDACRKAVFPNDSDEGRKPVVIEL